MSIDFLVNRLPPQAQVALRLANYAIIAGFLVYLMVMGTWLAWTSRARSFQGIPEISYSWVTMSLPVGARITPRHHHSQVQAIASAARRRRPDVI